MGRVITDKQKKEKAAKDKARREKAKKQVAADAKAKTTRAVKGTKPVGAAPEDQTVRKKRVMSEKAVKDLADDLLIAMDAAAKAQGASGNLITKAVKERNLNGPMFRIAHRLYRETDPIKLRLDLEDLDYYVKAMKLREKADRAPSLFPPGTGRPPINGEDGGEEDDTSGVTPQATGSESEQTAVH